MAPKSPPIFTKLDCPHDLQCPKAAATDYYKICKFAQRVAIPFTEYTRCRSKGFYIENFSYLILKKGERPHQFIDDIPCRLLLPTKKRTKHTICELCCPNGKAVTLIFSKAKQRELLRTTRKKEWGDTVIVPQELYDRQTNNDIINDDDDDDDDDDVY
uniref:Uncharacterized protein n=1 Tax=Amphimedon queenslandica TaxID=400682 RepID=A0A1X7U9Q7_AMPQE